MSEATGNGVPPGQADSVARPPGTGLVRPLRHVRAVRERYLQRFADPAEATMSRSARAWSWALGETGIAPVTDRPTATPPGRAEIEAEITEADERRLRGTQEGRADAAAAVLRWLIGADDHVPARCANPGVLVGGFGDVVRSRNQIVDMTLLAAQARRDAAVPNPSTRSSSDSQECARASPDYLDGVMATLAWVRGELIEAPITHLTATELTAKVLKRERVHAEDLIEHDADRWTVEADRSYGEGVKGAINWLLGDTTAQPVSDGCGR